MAREAGTSEKGGACLSTPSGRWGPTVLIVAGSLLTLLGVFFWGWVVQNTGPKSSLRHVPAWLIMSGIFVALAGAPPWLVWRFLARRAAKTKRFGAGRGLPERQGKGVGLSGGRGKTA